MTTDTTSDGLPPSAVAQPELRKGGWRLMREAAARSPGWIAIGTIASLGWTVAKVAVPLLALRAIDDGIDPYDGGSLLAWCLAIVGLTILIAIFTAGRRYAAFAISLRAEADLRRRLFDHLQGLHFGYHDRALVGQLMARANLDLKQVQLLLVFIPVAGANIVMIIGVAAVLLLLNVKLALLSLAALPFLSIAASRFSTLLHPVATSLQQQLAGVSEVVEESVSGIRVVKGFGAEGLQQQRLDRSADQVYEQAMAMARLRATFNPLLELLPMLGLVVVLFVGGREVVAGRLTVGELIAFNFYILQLIFPLRMTSFVVAQVSRASIASARVYEVLATEPAIADRPHARTLPDGPGRVCFEGVTFAYDDGQPVLEDFDLSLAGGESVALVGATGSGKSTVSRLLPRFYDVTVGRVTLDDVDVRDARLADLRGQIGMVFEDTYLFSDTVRANIAFAQPDAPDEVVHEAARLAGAHEFIEELPDGYDTVLGEQGFSLSGGQRQRIAIARAIVAEPRVLVLDDATSAVDPTKEHEIRAALTEVMAGRTTLIIAHRPATIALADRVVLIAGGSVVEEGTHEGLLETSVAYREVLAQYAADETAVGDAPEGRRQ